MPAGSKSDSAVLDTLGSIKLSYPMLPELGCLLQTLDANGCRGSVMFQYLPSDVSESWRRCLAPNRPVHLKIDACCGLSGFHIDAIVGEVCPRPDATEIGLLFHQPTPEQLKALSRAVAALGKSGRVREKKSQDGPELLDLDAPPEVVIIPDFTPIPRAFPKASIPPSRRMRAIAPDSIRNEALPEPPAPSVPPAPAPEEPESVPAPRSQQPSLEAQAAPDLQAEIDAAALAAPEDAPQRDRTGVPARQEAAANEPVADSAPENAGSPETGATIAAAPDAKAEASAQPEIAPVPKAEDKPSPAPSAAVVGTSPDDTAPGASPVAKSQPAPPVRPVPFAAALKAAGRPPVFPASPFAPRPANPEPLLSALKSIADRAEAAPVSAPPEPAQPARNTPPPARPAKPPSDNPMIAALAAIAAGPSAAPAASTAPAEPPSQQPVTSHAVAIPPPPKPAPPPPTPPPAPKPAANQPIAVAIPPPPKLAPQMLVAPAPAQGSAPPAPVPGMVQPIKKLGAVLVQMGKLTPQQVEAAAEQARTRAERLGDYLLHSGMVKPDVLCRALSLQTHLPMTDLSQGPIPPELGRLFPYALMVRHKFVVFDASEKYVCIAAANPLSKQTLDELKRACHREVEHFLGREDLIRAELDRLRGAHTALQVPRRYIRYDISVPLTYQFCGRLGEPMDEKWNEGSTVNISEGGFLVEGSAMMKKSPVDMIRSGICLNLTLTDYTHVLHAICRIKSIHPKKDTTRVCFGLEIADMSQEDRRRLKELCNKFMKRHPPGGGA